MPATDRRFDIGTRRAARAVHSLADEFRNARLGAGLSQQRVAEASRVSRAHYSRVECGKVPGLTIVEASRIASVLGLDLSTRAYAGSGPLRDAGQVRRLALLLDHVAKPLSWRTEVTLPASEERMEQRAWDAVIFGSGQRTAVELEMRVRDAQELERRIAQKRRDDPTEHFLLVLADTRSNRGVVANHPGRFADLERLRTARVLTTLRSGGHPRSGLVML